ncbi:MAG: hypothetical protein ACTHOL_18005 [Luteibacter jiangsuensis]
MKHITRMLLRRMMAIVARHPRLKRGLVDLVYRLPWVDMRLRQLAARSAHDRALLDLDIKRMPEGSRRSLERMKARMRQ